MIITKKRIAVATASLVLFSSGLFIGHSSAETELTKAQQNYEKAIQVKNAEIKELSQNFHPKATLISHVTETFLIKGITKQDSIEYIHAESISGGRTLNWPASVFWESIGEPKVGEYVAVSWQLEDYQKEYFNQITHIAKVAK